MASVITTDYPRLVAKAAGATVLITDISQSRLVKAGELGADHVYHVTDNQGTMNTAFYVVHFKFKIEFMLN